MSVRSVVLRLKSASTNSFTRPAGLVGITVAVGGPFLLLTIGGREANNLPWYIWTLIPFLLVMVVAAGFVMFRRDSHEGEDISIRPKGR